jgi:uncharacterized membrane protein
MKPLEARVAIGLVFLAFMIALPISFGAWIFGFASAGAAVLLYFLIGWAVCAAGFLSAMLDTLVRSTEEDDLADANVVRMKVKSANRG